MKPEQALQLLIEGLKRAPFSAIEAAGLQAAIDTLQKALEEKKSAVVNPSG